MFEMPKGLRLLSEEKTEDIFQSLYGPDHDPAARKQLSKFIDFPAYWYCDRSPYRRRELYSIVFSGMSDKEIQDALQIYMPKGTLYL